MSRDSDIAGYISPWHYPALGGVAEFCRLTGDPQAVHREAGGLVPGAYLLALAVGILSQRLVRPGARGAQRRYERVAFPHPLRMGEGVRLRVLSCKVQDHAQGLRAYDLDVVMENEDFAPVMTGRFLSILAPDA